MANATFDRKFADAMGSSRLHRFGERTLTFSPLNGADIGVLWRSIEGKKPNQVNDVLAKYDEIKAKAGEEAAERLLAAAFKDDSLKRIISISEIASYALSGDGMAEIVWLSLKKDPTNRITFEDVEQTLLGMSSGEWCDLIDVVMDVSGWTEHVPKPLRKDPPVNPPKRRHQRGRRTKRTKLA